MLDSLRYFAVFAVALFLLSGCGSDKVRVSSVSHDKGAAQSKLTPEEVGPALEALGQRVVQQVSATCERIDVISPSNAVRRASLLWRFRATEVSAAAVNRDNHIIGMVELWFWTASMSAYFGENGAGATAFGAGQADARSCITKLANEAEQLVKRTVPENGFVALRERVMTAAGKGELFTATAAESRDMLKSLLDVSHLEGLLSLPLAPFTALKGIGTGSDAVADLVVVAQRAVNLAERYPQLLTWNAQLAVLGVEEQETVRSIRGDLKRLVDIIDGLPKRLREESTTMLSDGATRDTLKQAEGTANALAHLAESIDAMLARIQTMSPPKGDGSNASASRLFDIREYESALRAAESTAREAHSVIAAATGAVGQPQVIDAANSAAERLERATDRIFRWSMVALFILGCIVAGLIMMHHSLDLRKHTRRIEARHTALISKKKAG